MKLICIGDVISAEGIDCLEKKLAQLKRRYSPDLVIVNGENSAIGNGIDKSAFEAIMNAGADVVTGGNHSFQRPNAADLHDESKRLIRPANVKEYNGGTGEICLDMGRYSVRIINLAGSLFMKECENPFEYMEKALEREKNAVTVVDFHTQASSEKQALAYFLDGRVSLVYGTHTHVQTADERILEGGTGYITDIGMTGVYDSVIGKDKDTCVHNFRYPDNRMRVRDAKGECMINGIYCQIDEGTGKCTHIERIMEK